MQPVAPHGEMQPVNLMVMHKAEKRYEVGKEYSKEEAKQRRLRAILNKLTPQNLDKLFAQVLDVNIDHEDSLACFVTQVHDKALMEPTYCEVYVDFCFHASNQLAVFYEDYEMISFRRLLLDRCQAEFEKGKRWQTKASRGEEREETEQEKIKAHRRAVGNIRLIGKLYRRMMLNERIIHGCIRKLLECHEIPDDENIELLCVLMSTIGERIDLPMAKGLMDGYFDVMLKLSTNLKLSSRIRFMLMDAIDLRKNKWQKLRRAGKLAPWMVLHKADERYVVSKMYDEEEIKQRKFRAILNKLTHQNFERLFTQVLEVNINNEVTLSGLVLQIYEKALMERTFCEVYAYLCFCIADELPDFSKGYERLTFKRFLVNKCQEEFEIREREGTRGNKAGAELQIKHSIEEREDEKLRQHARMLGNIQLIGELYKKRMLTERIIHHCIITLLGESQNPDEENIEALCTLISTVGEMIDHPKSKKLMDLYFDKMLKLSTNQKLPSRIRFLLLDAVELRNNRWLKRSVVERPMTIGTVCRNEYHMQQPQGNRWTCGRVITFAEEQTVACISTGERRHIRDNGAQYNETGPQYCTTDHAFDRSAATILPSGLIQESVCGSEVTHSGANLFSDNHLQGKMTPTRRVFFREGSSIIEIPSSSSDIDDEDGNLSPRRGSDIEVKLEEARKMEKECYILDSDPDQPLTIDVNKLSLFDPQEEDVSIIAERGQVACRDYPHSRSLCVKYPFSQTDHESYCPQCYCYVCDKAAPCEYWQGTAGHCHACDREEKWNELRRSCRVIRAKSSS